MERISRAEAVRYLEVQQDLTTDAGAKDEFVKILLEAGEKVGYSPAFRCLVKGLSAEESIRWGK